MDAPFAVRVFGEADRGPVTALRAACGLVVGHDDPDADIDRAAGRENSGILLGCLPDGALAASVMVGHDGHRGRLYDLTVDPAHRRRGFGRAMVRAGEDWLRRREIRKAQLMVRETNADVRAFHERIGWAQSPRIVMERWLQPSDPKTRLRADRRRCRAPEQAAPESG